MTDAEALAMAETVLAGDSPAERHFVLAVTRFETRFGDGWVKLAERLKMPEPEQYRDVNNMGAVTIAKAQVEADPGAGFFMRDRFWRRYPSREAGLRDAARTILKSNVRAALAAGDGGKAVAGMKANRYFEEDPNAYAKNVKRNYLELTKKLRVVPLLRFTTPSRGLGLVLVGGVVAAVLGALAVRRSS